MPCPELPYHPEILSLTLPAIMLNVFGAACSPAQYSESIYCQHNYSADMTIQAVAKCLLRLEVYNQHTKSHQCTMLWYKMQSEKLCAKC